MGSVNPSEAVIPDEFVGDACLSSDPHDATDPLLHLFGCLGSRQQAEYLAHECSGTVLAAFEERLRHTSRTRGEIAKDRRRSHLIKNIIASGKNWRLPKGQRRELNSSEVSLQFDLPEHSEESFYINHETIAPLKFYYDNVHVNDSTLKIRNIFGYTQHEHLRLQVQEWYKGDDNHRSIKFIHVPSNNMQVSRPYRYYDYSRS